MTFTSTPSPYAELDAWIDGHFDEEVTFLQQLVQVSTDTPPGNNAPHAERTAELLAQMGLTAEKHAVPAAEVKAAGGVRTLDALLAVMELGVTRIGATATEAMILDFRARKAGSPTPATAGPTPVATAGEGSGY